MITKLGLRILKLVVPTQLSGAFMVSLAVSGGCNLIVFANAFVCFLYDLLAASYEFLVEVQPRRKMRIAVVVINFMLW